MNFCLKLLIVLGILSQTSDVFAGEPMLLRLHLKQEPILTGKLLQMDSQRCWLMQPDGWMKTVPMKSISRVERTKKPFRADSAMTIRARLQRQYGRGYQVSTGRHYVVVGPPGRAHDYVELLDDVHSGFQNYFATRGFRINSPEFPLIAIVFTDPKAFADYCAQDGLRAVRGLRGYYSMKTNRVAIIDSEHSRVSDTKTRADQHGDLFATVAGNLRDTLVHEATHQVAFNTGLHARLGMNPRWVVEGLATVFEAPGILDRSTRHEVSRRINRERLIWFRNYLVERRPENSLEAFLQSDQLFQTATLDAYSQAWALSFYLIETRPVEYARYLQTVTKRASESKATSSQRVDDFREAFGQDLRLFEANFLRFMRRLSVN
ncbi:DUF1570 domain-containing protein [Thalassoroseus pseudoceratinae]|uniref:DUF1570 domain-containing protein n=1 Tax=Thalassoroseus pseudoceratinae TaxID=2713176 RepID=UPI0014226C39|nr:DUF1570 domain-containing protein [Thalassoroseus pseudoceratinae]